MMRSKDWIFLSRLVITVALFLVTVPVAWGQSDKGTEDLDGAFQNKIDATSTQDLDAVVKLCESAIEKGLDDEGIEQAKQLAASALFEHADQLGQRIFANGARDPRWRVYRTHALSRLKKAVKFQPKLGEAYLMIAKLNALPGGDKKESREAVEKAVELAGDDREQLSSALFYRASLSEDEETQLADLNQAIKINPENIDAVRVRAAYFLKKQEPGNALEDLNNWLASDEKNTANYIVVAEQLMATGDKFDEDLQQEALKIIDKAIEIDPDNSLPHTVRARINLVREKLDDAVADASRAVQLDQENVAALMVRATIFSEQDKLDDALKDVNQVLELRPLLVDGIQMRGMILSQQYKFTEAIEDIKLLANNDRSNQFYQRQLAMLYNANDQPSKAIRVYDKLLDENPDGFWEGKSPQKQLILISRRAAALRGRGDAQLSVGGHAEAVRNYEEAMELGEAIRGIEESEGVEEITKPDDGVLNNLAWVLATSPKDEIRDGKRAIDLATQAAEVTEFKQAHILSTLASGYAEVGDFENAIKWIEKAIEVNKIAGEEAVDKTGTDEQRVNLNKELESYRNNEPWRELQNVEKDKAKEKAEDDNDEGDNDEDDNDEDAKEEDRADDKEEDEKDEKEDKEGKEGKEDKAEDKAEGKGDSENKEDDDGNDNKDGDSQEKADDGEEDNKSGD